MKKILITGVAGFVGSHVAEALLSRGYTVSGLDNFSQGNRYNIQSFIQHKNFCFYEGDVCDDHLIDQVSRDIDCVVHLAAFKIPRYGGATQTLLINTRGTENILAAARKYGHKILFSSTSDVYGKNPQHPFMEQSDLVLGTTTIGRWAYAVSKIYDEHLCFAYADEFRVPVVVVRYFGGYGPRQNLSWRGGPQSVFIDRAFKKQPLPIHGHGNQKRSFTFISDLVAGTVAAIEKEEAVGHIFNIGNAQEISIIELAKKIWRMVQKEDPVFEFIPYSNFSRNYEDIQRRVPDIQKAANILGYVPRIGLEEGLKRTVAWQKERA